MYQYHASYILFLALNFHLSFPLFSFLNTQFIDFRFCFICVCVGVCSEEEENEEEGRSASASPAERTSEGPLSAPNTANEDDPDDRWGRGSSPSQPERRNGRVPRSPSHRYQSMTRSRHRSWEDRRRFQSSRTREDVYVPPFKLARMMEAAEDKESVTYQRLTWDSLRKSLNGIINKINNINIKHVLPELFQLNLMRGSGLLCRALMKSQATSPSFTPVYAALIAVVNTKFPEIGELLLHRVVAQFKRAYVHNDKPLCLAALTFIAHLVNQQVVHELLALEILALLLEHPSDDSVDAAVEFLRHCGALLQDIAPAGLSFVFDRLRDILHEGLGITTRAQYVIEGIYEIRRAGFQASGYPSVPQELDLVETEDQITHEVMLDTELELHPELDSFQEDPDFASHEAEYEAIKLEILGEEDEEEGTATDEDEEGGDEEEAEGGDEQTEREVDGRSDAIRDQTGTDLVNLRRTIYLTLQSSLDFEEAGHKLLKMGIPEGMEGELATMIIECCAQEKTFTRFYALLAERFCKLKRAYADAFAECFITQYRLVHRLETNKLRNVARLFAHVLATDALDWRVLAAIRLTEADTTSSSRIFIKILFQDLAEIMGVRALNDRLQDGSLAPWFEGLFPQDSMKNMRFSINFFTSIGLGGLTDTMRELLADLPRIIAEREAAAEQGKKRGESSSGTSTSSGRSSYSSETASSSMTSDVSSKTSSGSERSYSSGSTRSSESTRRRSGSTSSSSSSGSRERRRGRSPQRESYKSRDNGNKDGQRGDDRRVRRRSPSASPRHRLSPRGRRERRPLSRSPYRRRPSPPRRQPARSSSRPWSRSPDRRRSPDRFQGPLPRRDRRQGRPSSRSRSRSRSPYPRRLSPRPSSRRRRESPPRSPSPRRQRRRPSRSS